MALEFLAFVAVFVLVLVAWSASMWWQVSLLGRPRPLADGFRCRGGAEVDGYPMTWPLAEMTVTASTLGFRFTGTRAGAGPGRIAPMRFDRSEIDGLGVVRRAGNRRLVVELRTPGSLLFVPANWRAVSRALEALGWELHDG